MTDITELFDFNDDILLSQEDVNQLLSRNQDIQTVDQFKTYLRLSRKGRKLNHNTIWVLARLFRCIESGKRGLEFSLLDLPDPITTYSQASSLHSGCYQFFENHTKGKWISTRRTSATSVMYTVESGGNVNGNRIANH